MLFQSVFEMCVVQFVGRMRARKRRYRQMPTRHSTHLAVPITVDCAEAEYVSCSFHVAGSMGILVTLKEVLVAERGFSVGL